MGIQWRDGGYSAAVEIYLLVGGQKLAVSNLGPDFLVLQENALVPNGHAQLSISVDGREEVEDVIVHSVAPSNGANAEISELAYA